MQHDGPDDGRSLVSIRTMDIVVAIVLLALSAVVIFDSARLGIHWQENEGPASGYFPFYIALILATASMVNLVGAVLRRDPAGNDSFVSRQAFGRVLAVLVPAIVYVGLVQYLGIYVASALFIAFFMVFVGRDSVVRAIAVGVCVPIALFFMFEIWFLVPLPKGPLEAWLGY